MFDDSHRKRRKTNPRENANFLSKITFYFTYKLVFRGFRKELTEDDIYETLGSYKSIKLGNRLETEWTKELQRKQPSLFRTLYRTFGKKYFLYGITQLVFKTPTTLIRPLAMMALLRYFRQKPGDPKITLEQAFHHFSVIVACVFISTVYSHTYMLCLQQLALQMRISICSLIYRKCLTLSSFSLEEISTGKIVTMISKDVREFETFVISIHEAWVGVVHILLITYVMYVHVGVSAVLGVSMLLLFIPVQLWLSRIATRKRLQTAMRTDKRLRIIQEILKSIKIVKMYTWERYFIDLINECRKSEIKKLKTVFYLKTVLLFIGDIGIKLSSFVCILTYTMLNDNVIPAKMYFIVSNYLTMRSVVATDIPTVIFSVAEIRSSLIRIQSFLLTREATPIQNLCISNEPTIEMKGLSVELNSKILFQDVNLDLGRSLIGLIGPVGSGKSQFLKLILGDHASMDGQVKIKGNISYASQEPWLFPGTIKQNILFGKSYDRNRYEKILKICALKKDLENFPNGDDTIINDNGICLSKGQQGRINLARAVYSEADIYLLDNSLSSLDVDVSQYVFYNCIKNFLADKLVVLTTNNYEYLKGADSLLVIQNGTIENVDTFDRLEKNVRKLSFEHVTFPQYFQVTGDEPGDMENHAKSDESTKLLAQEIRDNETNMYYETKQQGKVNFSVYKTYFKLGSYWCLGLLLLMYTLAQIGMVGFEFFIKYWVNLEGKYANNQRTNTTNTEYITKMLHDRSKIPKIYFCLLGGIALTFIAKYIFLIGLTTKVSKRLHQLTMTKVIKARMHFFDEKLLGNILNRFSKDFATVDEIVPNILQLLFQNFFMFVGILFIMGKENFVFLILSCLFGIVSYLVRYFYLPACRSLKRLDGITRSPVIGHLKTSLEGLNTIRTSGVQTALKNKFDKCQDLHTSADYMYITTNRSLGFLIDILCSFYISSIILCCLLILNDPSTGTVGLAIMNAFGLIQFLQWTIRQWAELENQMTSVERILEYADAESEQNTGKDLKDWPKDGKISYENVNLRYPRTNQLVLKNVTFTMNPEEKICIIGRTGAGKSSLISTLYRLYDLESGRIAIDGCDTSAVKLDNLRSKISIIPQDPILFSGTLKTNLDPYGNYSDSDLWKVLNEVNIQKFTTKLQSDLYSTVQGEGSNMSSGQRQLICLARALLRNTKILILDEATSEMDNDTIEIIENVINIKFSKCTVLTIVHRLGSALSYDKVMVVADGSIIEYDDPKTLIKSVDTMFYKMMLHEGLVCN